MEDLSPKPGDLEAIETASRDEISALQLERMKWSLRHAYDNVPFYRQAFDAAGEQRIALAQQALAVSPDCADAYVLLA